MHIIKKFYYYESSAKLLKKKYLSGDQSNPGLN